MTKVEELRLSVIASVYDDAVQMGQGFEAAKTDTMNEVDALIAAVEERERLRILTESHPLLTGLDGITEVWSVASHILAPSHKEP
jgi:hypothetical protein